MTHMVLAQHLKVKEYLEYYKIRLQANDWVILDNGAYEGVTIDPDELLRWVKELKPSVVVLPDKIGDPAMTTRYSRLFIDRVPSHTKVMWVVHCHDNDIVETASQTYRAAVEQLRTGDYIAFSRLTKSYDNEMSIFQGHRRRLAFIDHLRKYDHWQIGINHHCLGMLDGDVQELYGLSQRGINSCDSSSPLWRGWHGKSMTDQWNGSDFDPFATDTGDWEQAKKNLLEVLEACR